MWTNCTCCWCGFKKFMIAQNLDHPVKLNTCCWTRAECGYFTDLGWRFSGWQRWQLGTEPHYSQPEPVWPGSAPSWSSPPETRAHQIWSSRSLAAQRRRHAGVGKRWTLPVRLISTAATNAWNQPEVSPTSKAIIKLSLMARSSQ